MNEGFLIVLVGGGLRYMKLTGGGGEQYFEPENDVPYPIRSVSIARSLMTFYKFSKKDWLVTHSLTHLQGDLYYPLVADKNLKWFIRSGIRGHCQ